MSKKYFTLYTILVPIILIVLCFPSGFETNSWLHSCIVNYIITTPELSNYIITTTNSASIIADKIDIQYYFWDLCVWLTIWLLTLSRIASRLNNKIEGVISKVFFTIITICLLEFIFSGNTSEISLIVKLFSMSLALVLTGLVPIVEYFLVKYNKI